MASLGSVKRETEAWVKEIQALCRSHGLKYKASVQSAMRGMSWYSEGAKRPVLSVDMWHGTGRYGNDPAILTVWFGPGIDNSLDVVKTSSIDFDRAGNTILSDSALAEYRLALRAAKGLIKTFLETNSK